MTPDFRTLTAFSGKNASPLLAVLGILAFVFGMELAGCFIFAEKIRELKKQPKTPDIYSASEEESQTDPSNLPAFFLLSIPSLPIDHAILIILEFLIAIGGVALAVMAGIYRYYLNQTSVAQVPRKESENRFSESVPQETVSEQTEPQTAPIGDTLSVFASSDAVVLPAEAEKDRGEETVEEAEDELPVSYRNPEGESADPQPYRIVETFVRETVREVVHSDSQSNEKVPDSDTVPPVDTEEDEDEDHLSLDEESENEDDKFNSNERIIGYNEETGCYRIAHYRKSFEAKLFQARPNIKEYYSKLKNELLSYKGTKSRISWTADSFHNGRKAVAKINVKTKILEIYLAIDPSSLEGTVYRGRDVSEQKKYADTPFAYKIKTPRKLNWALQLIAKTCEGLELEKSSASEEIDYVSLYPFADTEQLIERGLIKEYIREEKGATSFELDPTQPVREEDESDEANDDPLIEKETIRVTETHYREQFFGDSQIPDSSAEIPSFEHPDEEEATEELYVDDETGEVLEPAEAEQSEDADVPAMSESAQQTELPHTVSDPEIATVDLSAIEPYFADGATINLRVLAKEGLILENAKELKIYTTAPLKKRFTVEAEHFSFDAIRAISEAGGEASLLR